MCQKISETICINLIIKDAQKLSFLSNKKNVTTNRCFRNVIEQFNFSETIQFFKKCFFTSSAKPGIIVICMMKTFCSIVLHSNAWEIFALWQFITYISIGICSRSSMQVFLQCQLSWPCDDFGTKGINHSGFWKTFLLKRAW